MANDLGNPLGGAGLFNLINFDLKVDNNLLCTYYGFIQIEIYFGRTLKFGIGIEFLAVQWRLFPLWASVVRAELNEWKAYLGT